MNGPFRYMIAGALAALTLLGVGALAFLYSGIYPISASTPHMAPFRWAVGVLQKRAVQEHAEGVRVPPLRDPALVRTGLVLYREQCLVCHGAPGVERGAIGRGMNPNPPRLAMNAPEWTDAELYWIIRNGIKMGGMPAFWSEDNDAELWALVAFTRRLTELSEEEYAAMLAAVEGRIPMDQAEWVEDDDPGFAALLARGDAERGRERLDAYGCGSCHVIPGVRAAQGKVGPPLTRWAERHYIAGALINTPDHLVGWLVDPQAVEPGTAMPDLDVTPEDAWDMAAYLYTLGEAPGALHAALEEAGVRPRR